MPEAPQGKRPGWMRLRRNGEALPRGGMLAQESFGAAKRLRGKAARQGHTLRGYGIPGRVAGGDLLPRMYFSWMFIWLGY